MLPWRNGEEFSNVFKLIFADSANQDTAAHLQAIGQLKLWTKRRFTAELDLTACVLEVMMAHSNKRGERQPTDSELDALYTVVMIRFMNVLNSRISGMCLTTEELKSVPRNTHLRNLMRSHEMPEWLIEMRHMFCHSTGANIHPSLDMFRHCTSLIFDWLHKNYWIPTLASVTASSKIDGYASRVSLCEKNPLHFLGRIKLCKKKTIDLLDVKRLVDLMIGCPWDTFGTKVLRSMTTNLVRIVKSNNLMHLIDCLVEAIVNVGTNSRSREQIHNAESFLLAIVSRRQAGRPEFADSQVSEDCVSLKLDSQLTNHIRRGRVPAAFWLRTLYRLSLHSDKLSSTQRDQLISGIGSLCGPSVFSAQQVSVLRLLTRTYAASSSSSPLLPKRGKMAFASADRTMLYTKPNTLSDAQRIVVNPIDRSND